MYLLLGELLQAPLLPYPVHHVLLVEGPDARYVPPDLVVGLHAHDDFVFVRVRHLEDQGPERHQGVQVLLQPGEVRVIEELARPALPQDVAFDLGVAVDGADAGALLVAEGPVAVFASGGAPKTKNVMCCRRSFGNALWQEV